MSRIARVLAPAFVVAVAAATLLSAPAPAAGAGWTAETLVAPGGNGYGASSTLLGEVPHVFFQSLTAGTLQHGWWTGSAWAFETLDGVGATIPGHVDADVGGETSVVAVSSALHVFYQQDAVSEFFETVLRHAWYTPGVGWRAETLDGPDVPSGSGRSDGSQGFDTAALLQGGVLHVASVGCGQPDCSPSTWDALRHGWYTPGVGWTFETLDGEGAPPGGGRVAFDVSFGSRIGLIAGPHFWYRQCSAEPCAGSARLRHTWWNGAAWQAESLDGPAGLATGALACDTGYDSAATTFGTGPHVWYRGCSASQSVPQSLRHAWWTGAAWASETLDGPGAASGAGQQTFAVSGGASVVVVGAGPHVLYSACSAMSCSQVERLRHAWWNGATWGFETLDGPGAPAGGGRVLTKGEAFGDTTTLLVGGAPHVWYVGSATEAAYTQSLRHTWYSP